MQKFTGSQRVDQWYSKDLGDGVEAFTPSNKIMEAFMPVYAAAGQPVDMAVFSRYDRQKNIVTVYFSPGANALANMFGAVACPKPVNENDFGLLVGDQNCWELFYPGAQRNS